MAVTVGLYTETAGAAAARRTGCSESFAGFSGGVIDLRVCRRYNVIIHSLK